MAADKALWKPSPERREQANLTRFAAYLRQQGHEVPEGYEELQAWSVQNRDAFWRAVHDFHHIRSQGAESAYHAEPNAQGALGLRGRWFPGCKLNFAENLLRGEDDAIAIIEHREDHRRRTLTYAQLRDASARLANTLRQAGVGVGDRVAAFLPNGIEAIVGMLATARLGAVWSSCSPDFGFQGVLDRFGQIEPTVLIGINAYRYDGKLIDTRERMQQIIASLPALKNWIAVDNAADCPCGELDEKAIRWEDALAMTPLDEFTAVDFDAPLYILYSSGTTGVPKCIVHGVGGTLLQHVKELSLHTDVRADDVVFYYTTCGWMMWNWLASTLALGATVVLYDGSPFARGPKRLWQMAADEKITVFGASAKYYAGCEKAGLQPGKQFDLSALKAILSTGSPLAHESFDYIYREVKADVCLSSISGGTDIVSCFALGNPTLPVYRGELQCIGLAMEVDFVDDEGRSLESGKGELVCKNLFPSMPVGFWKDRDGEKFRAAYFESFPGWWAHGDFGEIRHHPAHDDLPAQRGVIIHGRSDAVLNPGGVRIGTAEIYRQVEKIDEVLESIAVGQDWQGDVRVVLFVRLRPGLQLDDELVRRIRQTVRSNTTPRHVPAKILQVEDIPRTISGKIVELAVRKVIHGEEVKNKDALANPEALAHFRDRPELKS